MSFEIELATPRGFCAGVDRAIEIVKRALDMFAHPIFVRHEVVHNRYVVENLRSSGAVFVDELHEVPDNSIVIFSAHGVSKEVEDEAKSRGLTIFDATCPLVTKVHMQVFRYSQKGIDCILIGHKGHPEVEGTMGRYDESFGGKIYLIETAQDLDLIRVQNPDNLGFVTQTTLSIDDTSEVVDALLQKFPNIKMSNKKDICYATENRQVAARSLAQSSDLVLVVGSPNSSNSNRLREQAQRAGSQAYLIDTVADLKKEWLSNVKKVGLTAGASAPEILVNQVIEQLVAWGGIKPVDIGATNESISFTLPKELRIEVKQVD